MGEEAHLADARGADRADLGDAGGLEGEARVGDRLVIANHDSEMHIVGPFTIGPGLVYDRVFTEPLILRNNFCTLHADAFVTVIVR